MQGILIVFSFIYLPRMIQHFVDLVTIKVPDGYEMFRLAPLPAYVYGYWMFLFKLPIFTMERMSYRPKFRNWNKPFVLLRE